MSTSSTALFLAALLSLGAVATPALHAPRGKQNGEALTPRELQVAALIARGRSNREIADELVIELSTAERHVANILRKLDLTSRTQVAVWFVERTPPVTPV